ncbi:aspartate aminotransferase-like enzyme [Scopulibacillus darangshiensis]|uniref:Aspartate aminotransferase-like enzyme n=1 Tax=Scopulibacillus darangshiensis TaxID=442528 RepID=A0A4R2P2Y7_9BACL|nr:alanine--glyoxylate aminotransferase family protein [Scopulibacillus darangshiensis]TCP28937.1 aspartate aminotransferase-like enzyme [Scopulibacillus darangshiensis]
MLLNQEFLFTPGPTPIPDRVTRAMNQPMIGHRSQAFSQLLEETSTRLKPVFGSTEPVYLVAGSGTSALETAVTNVVTEGDDVIVIVAGAFGDRFANVCEAYGANVHRLDIEWGSACTPDRLEDFIKQLNTEIKAVFATYCETSTGVLNPIKELGKVTKQLTDALFIVDGVSCIGAVPVDMKSWHIDVLVAGSQKALMLPPGLAFIAINDDVKTVIKNCRTKRFYFDLNSYINSYETQKSTPFTPAVSLINGALEVCKMIEEEGMEQVISRHQLLKRMVREGLKAIELPLLVKDEDASPTVTAVKPENSSANELKKLLQQRYSIILGGGQKKLKGEIFRIGHMGYSTPFDILKVLGAIEMAVSQVEGRDVLGKATGKAEEVWSHEL